MATLQHAGSRRLYSWWWDSHISPKNSKWLQENLTDMDAKVKAMIKLIEEDADSFARRAEMYYRKRPELMKLVEEFYRAYRALAERYDHANGALRQAQRTMAEAFPDQIPLILTDDSPGGTYVTEAEPHTPEMLPPTRSLFELDDSQKDDFGMSSHSHSIKRNGAFCEEKIAEGMVRKGFSFQEEEGKGSGIELSQKEISQLSNENKSLKKQITSESMRADKAEAEVKSLKETLFKLSSEKEDAFLQYQLFQERISNLETKISSVQEDFKNLSNEMLMKMEKLMSVEERCLLLGKENKTLQLELDTCKQSTERQQEELDAKQEVLQKLDSSIQDERQRCAQAEIARLSLEKLHSQSQEEVRFLSLAVQSGGEKLKALELTKVGLEEEIHWLKEENSRLNEQLSSFALKIKSLQVEIAFFKESKRRLNVEVGLHVDEKKILHQDICNLRADKNDLEQKHRGLTEQIAAVNLNAETLQALVKELHNGNLELKERCKKHGEEKVLLLENLKHMEKMSEKNAVLENSLSDANIELEGLREKIKTLEESCESLHGKISIHISEKAALTYQVEAIAKNVEKLSEKNTLLENSLCDVNVELEGLRGKLKVLEESCQSLNDQKSNLLAEKSTLVSEVESISCSLEKLESQYGEIEEKNLRLEREKDQMLHQVTELQDFLKVEKEEHETFINTSLSQLTTLENQIRLLQEEGQCREDEIEVEQQKFMNARLEIFILQRCVGEIIEKNVIISEECQKNLEALKCAERLVFELEQEISIREKNLALFSKCNRKLVEGLHLMMKMLNIHEDCGSADGTEDYLLCLQLILRTIRNLQNALSDAQDDTICLTLEKSVILTLVEQLGLDVADLKSEKNVLDREFKARAEELSMLQNEKHGLLVMNEQLRWDVKACNQREDVLKAEMEILCGRLSHLQEGHCTLENKVCSLLEENQTLSKTCNDLMESKERQEKEYGALLVEAMTLECLYLIFKSTDDEKALEMQLLSNDLDCLRGIRHDLDQEIRQMNEKMGALEVENMHLKKSVDDLEESRRRLVFLEGDLNAARNIGEQLNQQMATMKILLVEKDKELSQANQKIQATQDNYEELCRNIEGLVLDIGGAKMVRGDLEKKIISLSEYNAHRDNEIACLCQTNDILNMEQDKLNKEIEKLMNREKHLISELREGTDVIKSCETEIAALLNDIHVATLNAAVFEEKILELVITCESLEIGAMVQREMLYEEIKLRNMCEDELTKRLDAREGENRCLKEELNAYLPLIKSLSHGVSSLEEYTLKLKCHTSENNEKRDNSLISFQYNKSNEEQNADDNANLSTGILELQKLHTKVNMLEKVLMDAMSLEQERSVSNASLETVTRESKGTESNGSESQQEAQIGKDIVLELENSGDPGRDCNLQEGDAEISKVNSEQMMKDIQLDHVLSSSNHGNGISSCVVNTVQSTETDDQMLALWETVSRDCSKMQKASSVTSEHDIEYHQVEALEDDSSECPSGLVAEKELSIDKQELPKKVTQSHRKQNNSVIERLFSDAQRLSVLQTSVQDLKRDIETSETSTHPTSLEFDTVKTQLKEAEGAILQLIDTNSKLTKKSEDFSASSDSLVGEQNEIGNRSEKQISEEARRGSEKIARLELELQKIQYILLKLKDEYETRRTKVVERKTRVLLRDYIYGRKERQRKNKIRCCACMRPKANGD